jgi:manganese-dependent ADP-ribose/CDP-alcohol diphosphatase
MTCLRYLWLTLLFVVECIHVCGQPSDGVPLFSFGLVADVQYADAEQWGKRDYRGSLKRLEAALEILNSHHLAFIVHAGDLIDRDYRSFQAPMSIFGRSKAPVHFVIGNHEFAVGDSLKKSVRKKLNNPRGYYAFREGKMQFILVDAMDVSLLGSQKNSRDFQRAQRIHKDLKEAGANNAHEWNGAMGARQLKWLKRKLRRADRRDYKAVLFSHLPLLPENGLQLWNNREVVSLLNAHPSVVAFISGHHHEGGYVNVDDIHHLTLKGLVEATASTACAVADVFPDRIVVKGFGDQKSYTLWFPGRQTQ